MQDGGFTGIDKQTRPFTAGNAIGITEDGLVFSGGSLLIRMRKDGRGELGLAIGADRERMLAMLSVVHGRPIVASEVIPQVETAADLWYRGDRALANLLLAFSGLAGPHDPAAGHRVALAACLLERGWPPAASD